MHDQGGRTLGILLVLVTAVAAMEGFFILRLERRVATVEEKTSPSAPGRTDPLALGDELEEMRERQERQQSVQKAMGESAREVERRVEALESAAAIAPVLTAGERGGANPAAIRSAIEEAVAKQVDQKLKTIPQRGEGGEWKQILEELREALALSEEQIRRAERIIDDSKHELFELAGLRREDGSSFLDDLVGAMKDPTDPEAAAKRVFMTLFTKKIPGREETYIAEIIRLKQSTEKSLTAFLDEEQGRKLRRSNIDYLGVKTAYDPFAEYIQESFK